ncbi:MAG TPA: DUF1456 family protein [Pelobium sp.]|nr:DUF1456 family protein [Pelobium sp.]
MTNNDILRRLRYTFELSDDQMIKIFALADKEVTRAEVSEWLKKDDQPDYKPIYDIDLSIFLNGFINLKRGKKEGEQPKPEKKLNNNIVFRKLRIALGFKDEDIVEALELVNFRISKHELSAFFRNPAQNQYRPCKDQILRNFIHGIQVKFRKVDDQDAEDITSN